MDTNFKEIQNKLDEYKENYTKVQFALKKNAESTIDESLKSQREKDLSQLLHDIEKAIEYHQDLLKISKSNVETYFSSIKLKPSDIGKKCNLYYEKDQKWYPGEISSVNIQNQTAEVIFFGYTEHHQVPASYIQILIPPKRSDLIEGLGVEALLTDGKWHYSSIESINNDLVTVRLARWGHKHSLSFDSIRLISEEKRSELEKETLTIPEKFKILPNDTSEARKKKKQKIKALKKAWRQNQTEKETTTYVSSWKNFQQKISNKKESIFKTPDNLEGKIGIANSGLGMTAFKVKKQKTEVKNED